MARTTEHAVFLNRIFKTNLMVDVIFKVYDKFPELQLLYMLIIMNNKEC